MWKKTLKTLVKVYKVKTNDTGEYCPDFVYHFVGE